MGHNKAPKPGSKYYLPKYRYKTVVNFCFQYPELKDELRALDGFRSHAGDGMPHGSGTGDPTAASGERRAELSSKIDLIETTVKECVGGVLYPYMLRGVTDENCTYTYLRTVMSMPLSVNAYTKYRRKIYYTLSKRI